MKLDGIPILILSTLLACAYSDKGDVVDKRKLMGRYVYQSDGRLTIEVNSDGTYTNYTLLGERKLENAGTWVFDSLNSRVKFQDFSFLTDTMDIGDSTFVPRGTWDTRVENERGEIRLIYASDIHKGYFLRVDSIDRTRTGPK